MIKNTFVIILYFNHLGNNIKIKYKKALKK